MEDATANGNASKSVADRLAKTPSITGITVAA